MNLRQEIDGLLKQRGVIELDEVSTTLLLDALEALILREKREAVEEAVPLGINAFYRHFCNKEVQMEGLIAEVQNIMFGSGTYTDPSSDFSNTISCPS